MQSYFNAQHWYRVKRVRDERGLNRIPAEAMLRPTHPLMGATLLHRASGEHWMVTAVREEWHLGRYLVATLARAGVQRTYVVELITCDDAAIAQEVLVFSADFEVQTQ